MTEHDWYSGKGTTQTSISQYPEGIDYDWDTNDSDSNLGRYSRWDVAMRLGAGVQYKRVFLEFEYNFGLLNRTTKDLPTQLGETRSGWDKTRRDELALSLGLTF